MFLETLYIFSGDIPKDTMYRLFALFCLESPCRNRRSPTENNALKWLNVIFHFSTYQLQFQLIIFQKHQLFIQLTKQGRQFSRFASRVCLLPSRVMSVNSYQIGSFKRGITNTMKMHSKIHKVSVFDFLCSEKKNFDLKNVFEKRVF